VRVKPARACASRLRRNQGRATILQTLRVDSRDIQGSNMSGKSSHRGGQIAHRGKVRHHHDVDSRMHELAINEDWLNAHTAPDSGTVNKARQRLAVKTAHK
jgi:hypothetical protein